MTRTINTKEWVTTGEAARRLGISHSTLLRAVRRGEVQPALRTPGGALRFDRADLDAYAQRLAAASQRSVQMPARRTGPDLVTALSAAVDQGVVLFALDAAGAITACQGTLGFAAEVTAGQSIFEIYHDDLQILDQVRRALAGESVTFVSHPRGAVLELRLAPQRDGAGTVTGVIGVATDVTALTTTAEALRVREEALLRSEARARALLESAPDAIIVINRDGHIILANTQAELLFGYARQELHGRPVEMLLPERMRAAHVEQRARYQAAPRTRPMGSGLDLYARRRDGSKFPVEISLSPLSEGGQHLVTAVIRDITERRAAEAAQRKSEAAFRRAFEDAAIGMSMTSLDNRYLQVNPAFCRMFGYTQEQLVGIPVEHLTDPRDWPLSREHIDLVLRGGARHAQFDKRYRHRDGHTVWTHITISVVTDEVGHPAYFTNQLVDITAQVQAEEALRTSEERFRLAFNEAPSGMALATPDGQLLQVNQALCQMLGYNEQELLDLRSPVLTHPDDLAESRERIRQLLAGEIHSATLEKRYLHKQGQVIWTNYTASLLRAADGRPLYFIYQLQDITARRAVQEAQAQLAAIVAGSSDAIIGITLDRTIISWNTGAERLYGYTAAEAIGRCMDLLAVPGGPHEGPQIREALLRGEAVVNLETERQHRDGRALAVSISISPITDASGVVTGAAGIHRDIAAQKAMEEELRASEARFRGLVHAAPVGVCILDEHGVFEEVNGTYAALLGYQPEELVGQHFQIVFPESLQAEARAAFQQILARDTQNMSERVLLRKDGSTCTALGTSISLRGRDGRPRRASFVVDIEERKAAERAVEEARALAAALDRVSFALAGTLEPDYLYRIILEQAMAVLPCDNAAIYMYSEGWAWAAATRGEPTVPVGTRLFPISGPDRPWLATDQPSAVYLPDTDLEPAWVHMAPWVKERRFRSVIGVPLHIEGETVGVFQIYSRTPRRYHARHLELAEAFGARIIQALRNAQLYTEEQQRATEAEDFAQLQSDFLGAVSHELLSPLSAVKGLAELLRTRWPMLDDDRRGRFLEGIAAATDRQQRLVKDLLDVSRADAEGFHCERTPFALRLVLERVAAEVQESYHGQRIELQGPAELVAEGDAGRTQQILVNLMDNAAKYSPEGSPMMVSWGLEDGWVVVRVRDHGLGIPEGGREQLFTRFGRLAGSTVRAGRGGTGLGLYLSRLLARAMGGELDLESTGPHGSTFRVLLPSAPQA